VLDDSPRAGSVAEISRIRRRALHRLGLVLIVALASVLIVLLVRATAPWWWMATIFLSGPIIFAARVTAARTLALTLLLAVALAVGFQMARPHLVTAPIALAYGLGTACIVVSFFRVAFAAPDHSREATRTALLVVMFPAKAYLGITLLEVAATRTPLTFDSILTVVDGSIGPHPSFVIGRFLLLHPSLRVLAQIAYNALPIAIMSAAALRWRRFGATDRVSIPLAAAIAAVTGVALYLAVPAAGPAFRWPALFPLEPPAVESVPRIATAVGTDAFRNAMPSLHFAGALFVAWGMWSLGAWQRLVGIGFLFLTFIATLGLGEHYLIDLIVALPFALGIEAVVRHWPRWQGDFALCAALLGVWLFCLRFLPEILFASSVTWLFVGTTLGACGIIALRLTERGRVPAAQPAQASV
jgi:hypothetical protein